MSMIFCFHMAVEQSHSTKHMYGSGMSLVFSFKVMFFTHFLLHYSLAYFFFLLQTSEHLTLFCQENIEWKCWVRRNNTRCQSQCCGQRAEANLPWSKSVFSRVADRSDDQIPDSGYSPSHLMLFSNIFCFCSNFPWSSHLLQHHLSSL